jgi:uncharacterized protein YwqG
MSKRTPNASTMTESEFTDRLLGSGVSAAHLIAARGRKSLSKIGGIPDLPPEFEWPVWDVDALAFLAQIDLAGLPKIQGLPGLPNVGLLYFFCETEFSWGYDPSDRDSWHAWRVFYVPTTEGLVSATSPKGEIFDEKRVQPREISSIPPQWLLEIDPDVLPDDAYEIEEDLRAEVMQGEAEHQVGGHPNPIQVADMESKCQSGFSDVSGPKGLPAMEESGTKDWRLLFQLDSDDDTGMMWGDSGRLYFWIRVSDLARLDFSNVWMVPQCC